MAKVLSNFDEKELITDFTKKSDLILDSLLKLLAGISPNKIDMIKLESVTSMGKTLKEHKKSGAIMIIQNGPRNVRIESLNEGHKIFRSAITGLMDAGFVASENSGAIIIGLPQITEDMRKEVVKQVKVAKEATKHKINELRSEFHKKIKNMSNISEDIQYKAKADIDKAKDTYQARLDNECLKKENEIMRG